MNKLIILLACLIFLLNATLVKATYDPESKPNNKFGIHILFPSEIDDAAKLVNSSGGDWGYVTIPIQENDLDLNKWQNFMDNAKKLHIIPIIRIATVPDYFNTGVWQTPTDDDVLDMANFLNSLSWPTKNRYVVIYNEVNRADEWGGSPNSTDYADILGYAVKAFKSKNQDFFIISAGLDNGADNSNTSTNEYNFLEQMGNYDSQIFTQIDGIGSHSYPNPAFSKPPVLTDAESVNSFSYESQLIDGYSGRNLPVFITETGWDGDKISESDRAEYFKEAFANVWSNGQVIAVTPFILKASGPFEKFSFISQNGQHNAVYNTYQSISKQKGEPEFPAISKTPKIKDINLPIKDFSDQKDTRFKFQKYAAKQLLKVIFNTSL